MLRYLDYFIFFLISCQFILFLYYFKFLYSVHISKFIFVNKIQIEDFINNRKPLNTNDLKYFLTENISNLLQNYKLLTPNPNLTQYHELLPFHAIGILKKELDYREILSIKNVNIKHFTSFLSHGDKHEHENRTFLIQSQNSQTEYPLKKKNNFTLIYGILTGKLTPLLIREIKAISNIETAIIIFIDNKSNRTLFYDMFSKEKTNSQFENVYFIDSPRFYVYWGQLISAFPEIVMAQAALKFFPNSLYISFHTESDYPIIPNDCIINYLKRHYPNNYINEIKKAAKWRNQRKNKFYLFFDFPYKEKVLKMIRFLFPKKKIPDVKWGNGPNWNTMTLKDARKMIDVIFKKFEIIDTLEYASFGDEIIFQTLQNEARINSTNDMHRYIDWRDGDSHPLVFTENNFNDIKKRKCDFWARKFKLNESKKVLDLIDLHIKNFNRKKFRSECYEY